MTCVLDDDLFEIQTPSRKATRREKRLTRQKLGLLRAKDQSPNEELPADLSREELQKLQELAGRLTRSRDMNPLADLTSI